MDSMTKSCQFAPGDETMVLNREQLKTDVSAQEEAGSFSYTFVTNPVERQSSALFPVSVARAHNIAAGKDQSAAFPHHEKESLFVSDYRIRRNRHCDGECDRKCGGLTELESYFRFGTDVPVWDKQRLCCCCGKSESEDAQKKRARSPVCGDERELKNPKL